MATRADADRARREARELAAALGMRRRDAERIALLVSELAANLVRYAHGGRIVLVTVTRQDHVGLQVESHDDGPGIDDLAQAMEDGYSTGGGLGSGLPATRRLADEFEIRSSRSGTHILARAWKIAG